MRALLLVGLASCALTSKSPPLDVHYFAPPIHPVATEHRQLEPRAQLQLGRIVPSQLLRHHVVVRMSPVELQRYETMRWTDSPEAYVRRSLALALFEGHPLEQAIGGDAPMLDVDVLAFEEVRHGMQRLGRVELRYVLHDASHVIARGTVATEREARSRAMDDIVAAIGAALDAATTELAARIAAKVIPA